MAKDRTNPNDDNAAAAGRNGPGATLIVLIVVAALAVIFFLQNGEQTSIDFLIFESRTTIRWSILMAFLFGVLADRLVTIWWRRRRRDPR